MPEQIQEDAVIALAAELKNRRKSLSVMRREKPEEYQRYLSVVFPTDAFTFIERLAEELSNRTLQLAAGLQSLLETQEEMYENETEDEDETDNAEFMQAIRCVASFAESKIDENTDADLRAAVGVLRQAGILEEPLEEPPDGTDTQDDLLDSIIGESSSSAEEVADVQPNPQTCPTEPSAEETSDTK